ncbi:MAG: endolytic transglycosylase MltG [Trueperaceae bacterium]|nr:MAG: endolytic transglycosylase MltG [Trueperaceae bacterium]
MPEAEKQREKSQRSWLANAFLLLLIGVLLLAGAALYLQYQLTQVSTVPNPTEFEVLPGWRARRVASELESSGLIRDARVFVLWLRYQELDRRIGEGLYDLDPFMSAIEIGEVLAGGGRPRTTRVTIPEGFRARDIASRLENSGLGSADTYLELFSEAEGEFPDYLPVENGLEGYLFPASYDIPVKSSSEDVLNLLVERFEQEVTSEISAALLELELTVHDWVTLASMIQAEAANSEEMPIIAGVFLNRLDRDMLLQSDPTIAYGLGKDLPELNAPAGDFEVDHPWNTYTRGGLPLGPIGNPGSDALGAVLEPQRHNGDGQAYLYFLHGFENDQPVFRPNINLADHNRDVRRYLR